VLPDQSVPVMIDFARRMIKNLKTPYVRVTAIDGDALP